jgi:CubicO group peptidase (beta-lactamase class C family)
MLRLAFSLMLALPLFGYTQDYTKDDLFLDLDDLLQTKHTQYGLEGAAISVRLKDASVWTGTAGNRAPSDPIDPNLQWNLGSMQKSFVAIMIMQLIEEGSLQLDDAIGSYLNTDTLPNIDSAITVRSLLNHTSPLNDGWYENSPFENDVWADRSAIWNVEQTLPYAEAPEASPSGEHRYMPHINFALLGLLVESVTGNDLSLEIEERIFNPLGLNNAVLCASAYDMALLNGVYKGSQSRSTWNHNSYLTSRFAINIAIEDLVYVHHALHHGMLMDTNVAAMMRNETVPTTNAGPIPCGGQVEVDYGYGLLVPKMAFSEDDTMTTYGHSGT